MLVQPGPQLGQHVRLVVAVQVRVGGDVPPLDNEAVGGAEKPVQSLELLLVPHSVSRPGVPVPGPPGRQLVHPVDQVPAVRVHLQQVS